MADRTEFNYLYAPEGHTLMADDQHSYLASEAQPVQGASLAALSAKNKAKAPSGGLAGTTPAPYRPKPKQLTPDELERMANAMMAEHEANYAMGPSVGSERDASGQRLPSWLTDYMK